jgi:hypothetical protein
MEKLFAYIRSIRRPEHQQAAMDWIDYLLCKKATKPKCPPSVRRGIAKALTESRLAHEQANP